MQVLSLEAVLTMNTSPFSQALDKVAGLGFGAAKQVAGAVAGFAQSSVQAGQVFDASMSRVAATMGKSVDEMKDDIGTTQLAWGEFTGNLREFAQEMGEHTAFTASQSAEALNYMALAGYDAQMSMEMLPSVMNLAAAGAMDLGRASDVVTDAQTAFGLTAERTALMVNEMAKAASTGNTSVAQLGDAFLVVGGLAQELNGGMVTLADGTQAEVDGVQELEIALTAMANAGVKGSEAGTHMRNMLLKLSNPTSDGTQALEDMGVAVFDTEGKMRSLSDIFGDLDSKLSQMSQQEKISIISDLFNARDIASAEALLNAVGEDWDRIGASILTAGQNSGAATEMADTQLDNLQGQMTLFQSAWEGMQIALSDAIAPALKDVVKAGAEGITKLTEVFKSANFKKKMEDFGKKLGEIAQKLIDFLLKIDWAKVVDMVADALGKAADIVLFLADNLNVIIPIIEVLIGLLVAWKAVQLVLNIVMLANPIGLIIAAIGALIAAITYVVTHIEEVSAFLTDFFANIGAWLENIWTTITDFFSNLISGIGEWIAGIWNSIIEWFTNLFQKIGEFAKQAFEAGKTFVENIGKGFAEFAVNVWNSITGWVSDLWGHITDFFSNAWEIGKSLVEGIWNGITGAGEWLWDKISGFFGGIWDGILDFFGIHSPSKKGEYLTEMLLTGMGNEFSRSGRQVIDSAEKLNEDILGAFDTDASLNYTPEVSSVNQNYGVGANGMAAQQGQEFIIPRAGSKQSQELTVVLQLDRMTLGKAVYELYNDRDQMVGVRLAGV